MPIAGEHSARLENPARFDKETFRRTAGGTIYGRIDVPKTVGIIWAKLKTRDKPTDPPLPQSLRFPIKNWTVSQAKTWIKDNKIKPDLFEPAESEKGLDRNEEEIKTIEFGDSSYFPADFDKNFIPEGEEDNKNLLADEEAKENTEIEYKTFDFTVSKTKKYTNEDGDEIGVFYGKMATEHRDLGNDIIEPEAFDESIADYISRKRNIPLYYQHNTYERPIGIIQAKEIKKEGKSWNVKGELNLDTQAGREIYSLLKQGALADLSFGYGVVIADVTRAGIRKLKKLSLDEVSVVGKPMNPKATIDEVKEFKAVIPFKDFPIVKDKDGKADTKFKWDGDAADKRVRKFVGAEDEPNAKYKAAHMWFDPDKQDNFTGYKLLYVDVINDKLQVVPRAIFEKAALLRGGRAGLNVSDEDKKKIASHVNKYYDKMELPSPLRNKNVQYLFNDEDELQIIKNFDIDDIEHIVTQKSFEDLLKSSGVISRKAATYLAKFFNPQTQGEPVSSKNNELKQSESVDDSKGKFICEKLNELINQIKKFAEN